MNEVIQLEALSSEALGEVIRARAGEFDKATMRAVEHAWHAGRALLAAKKLIPHGQWGHWLANNFEGRSHDTARIWMRLAANYESVRNLEDVKHGIKLLDEAPEQQAKKAEREAKKLETSPKSLAPATPAPPVTVGTIRHESPPSQQPQPERPAWLADPDELERPEETDLPQLPRTNAHHTAANRRQPDARETDRIGLVTIDDPRDYVDGAWYEFDEASGRLFAVTHDQILQRAAQVMAIRSREAMKNTAHSGAATPEPCDTKKVVERERDTKRFVRPTVAQVAAYAAEIGAAIDPEQFIDFYTSKDWMIGKNKMKDWKAAVRTWKRQQAGKAGSAENGKVRSANWEDDGTGWEDLRDG